MSKDDFIALVAETGALSKAEAGRAVKAFCDAVTAAMEQGDDIKLPGFGSFEVQERAARQGRNLRTGEPLVIAASKAVRFSAGRNLKAAVSGTAEQGGVAAAQPQAPSAPQMSGEWGPAVDVRRRGKKAAA
ncbi:HU family DNA-binding protein [Belnapia sp. T18]|uniref:HU family DNA-binding protein n=1 Tax=Belnapia arida TaxID=2804533 RepID=A0ABS1UAV6_9PROT|nr:HU family DNA-binding protein [Belnapia arida]MBL6081827.1 HU family DNA-binding protein [Belnapia arida]